MSLVTLTRSPAVSDAQQYRLLCAAVFPFFLAAASINRLRGAARRTPGATARSVLADARAASANALLFAFGG